MTAAWALIVVTTLTARIVTAQTPSPITLRIGVVTPRAAVSAAEYSALRGVRLGAIEAKQTARLFGSSVDVYEASGDGRNRGAVAAADFLATRRGIQILIGTSAADADTLSKFAESRRLIFLNVASRSAALRAACRRYSFHIEASDAMYANARRSVSRDRARSTVASPPPDAVTLWDARLERFGASQLNDRFRDLTKSDLDGPAWAAWLAVKIAAESALRTGASQPQKIRDYLESPATQFDGHKGWPLSFRAADHQLRQPLYIVAAVGGTAGLAARIADVPDLREVAPDPRGQDAQNVLDRLSTGSVSCRWSSH